MNEWIIFFSLAAALSVFIAAAIYGVMEDSVKGAVLYTVLSGGMLLSLLLQGMRMAKEAGAL